MKYPRSGSMRSIREVAYHDGDDNQIVLQSYCASTDFLEVDSLP